MKVRVLIDKVTGRPDGVTICSVDADIDFVQPSDTHDVLDVACTHPVIYEQLEWEAPKRIVFGAEWDRVLMKKADIVAELEAVRVNNVKM
jgi:hypothetical protein